MVSDAHFRHGAARRTPLAHSRSLQAVQTLSLAMYHVLSRRLVLQSARLPPLCVGRRSHFRAPPLPAHPSRSVSSVPTSVEVIGTSAGCLLCSVRQHLADADDFRVTYVLCVGRMLPMLMTCV